VSEKDLHWAIARNLAALGFDVTSTAQPQRAMMTAGVPDLYVRHERWGIRVWLEVKTAKGRVRPSQAAWIERERRAGGHAAIVRSTSDAIEVLKAAGAPLA
jgi:hypothetical protein